VLVIVVAVASSSCARVMTRYPLPLQRLCVDNQPIKILQDARCPLGICGYSCEPDRWRASP